MRTTLDIDKELISQVMEITGESSKSRAVGKALEGWMRQKRIEDLLELRGKLDLDLDDWYEFRHMER